MCDEKYEYKYMGTITCVGMDWLECEVETKEGPKLINIPIIGILSRNTNGKVIRNKLIENGDDIDINITIKHFKEPI